jgi:hypothetical protein
MKIKHKARKKKKENVAANPTGRPPSPVTIIAKKKTKPVSSSLLAGQTQPADHHLRSPSSLEKKQNPFLFHRRPAKPNRQTTISGDFSTKPNLKNQF